jgi:hypothetical protein
MQLHFQWTNHLDALRWLRAILRNNVKNINLLRAQTQLNALLSGKLLAHDIGVAGMAAKTLRPQQQQHRRVAA